jgi:hypothetical protein
MPPIMGCVPKSIIKAEAISLDQFIMGGASGFS